FDSIQPHYHLLNRPEVEPELAELCLDQGVGMIPYSPLAGGFLTGKYTRAHIPEKARFTEEGEKETLAALMTEANFAVLDALREVGEARGKSVLQMALGWLLTLPYVTAPIIGANTVAQLEGSLGAVGLRLTEAEMDRLDAVTGVKRVTSGG